MFWSIGGKYRIGYMVSTHQLMLQIAVRKPSKFHWHKRQSATHPPCFSGAWPITCMKLVVIACSLSLMWSCVNRRWSYKCVSCIGKVGLVASLAFELAFVTGSVSLFSSVDVTFISSSSLFMLCCSSCSVFNVSAPPETQVRPLCDTLFVPESQALRRVAHCLVCLLLQLQPLAIMPTNLSPYLPKDF